MASTGGDSQKKRVLATEGLDPTQLLIIASSDIDPDREVLKSRVAESVLSN